MPSVSVIVRTYTEARWRDLLLAQRSIEAQTSPAAETIVVVDHNAMLEDKVRQALPGVVVVPNREVQGSSGAWNSGIQAAKGEILAFIDDDATASPDWLEQLQLGYRNSEVVGVGGEIVPMWIDGRPGWFPAEFHWVIGCTYLGLSPVEASVRNLIGCNMSFRREVFEAIGGFRGAEHGIGHMGGAPVGCDETELCIRIGQRWPNKTMLYRPQARVYHTVPSSRTTWKYFRSRCYLEGRSKARVAHLVGTQAGLEAERAHALRALPKGVARGVRDFAVSRNAAGLGRAAAIVGGFAWASFGYLSEMAALRGARRAKVPTTLRTVVGDRS